MNRVYEIRIKSKYIIDNHIILNRPITWTDYGSNERWLSVDKFKKQIWKSTDPNYKVDDKVIMAHSYSISSFYLITDTGEMLYKTDEELNYNLPTATVNNDIYVISIDNNTKEFVLKSISANNKGDYQCCENCDVTPKCKNEDKSPHCKSFNKSFHCLGAFYCSNNKFIERGSIDGSRQFRCNKTDNKWVSVNLNNYTMESIPVECKNNSDTPAEWCHYLKLYVENWK